MSSAKWQPFCVGLNAVDKRMLLQISGCITKSNKRKEKCNLFSSICYIHSVCYNFLLQFRTWRDNSSPGFPTCIISLFFWIRFASQFLVWDFRYWLVFFVLLSLSATIRRLRYNFTYLADVLNIYETSFKSWIQLRGYICYVPSRNLLESTSVVRSW